MGGFCSSHFAATDIPDLSGKVVIVTGGTAGLGLASAIELARKGAHVIITARSQRRGEEALQKVKEALSAQYSASNVEFGIAENADLKSIKAFAEWFLAKNLPLHVLMLNAGVAFVPYKLIQGVESMLFINHVSHQLLAQLLLQKLRESAPSRVVAVSSLAHTLVSEINLETPTKENYSSMKSYGNSKLANILFTKALQKRAGHDRIYANAIHPGGVATNIISEVDPNDCIAVVVKQLLKCTLTSVQEGALTQLYAATSPEIEARGYKGQYFTPVARHTRKLKACAEDEKRADRLWEWTERKIQEVLAKS